MRKLRDCYSDTVFVTHSYGYVSVSVSLFLSIVQSLNHSLFLFLCLFFSLLLSVFRSRFLLLLWWPNKCIFTSHMYIVFATIYILLLFFFRVCVLCRNFYIKSDQRSECRKTKTFQYELHENTVLQVHMDVISTATNVQTAICCCFMTTAAAVLLKVAFGFLLTCVCMCVCVCGFVCAYFLFLFPSFLQIQMNNAYIETFSMVIFHLECKFS